MHQPMQGAGAQVDKSVTHWSISRDRVQMITTNLDLGRMTLKAARIYFSAYGVEIPGRTKKQFIQNLFRLLKDQE